jgi:hypothetical protein
MYFKSTWERYIVNIPLAVFDVLPLHTYILGVQRDKQTNKQTNKQLYRIGLLDSVWHHMDNAEKYF